MREWIVKVIYPDGRDAKIYVDAENRANVFEKLHNAVVAGGFPVGSEFQLCETVKA